MTNRDKELIIARIFNVLSDDVQIQSGKFAILDTTPIVGSIEIKCDNFEINLLLDADVLNFLGSRRLQGNISIISIPGLLQMIENSLRYDFPGCAVVSKTNNKINLNKGEEVETFKITSVSESILVVAKFKQDNNKDYTKDVNENNKTNDDYVHRTIEIYNSIIDNLMSVATDVPHHKQSLDTFYTDSSNENYTKDIDKNKTDDYEIAEIYNNVINALISIATNIAYREQSLNIFYIDSDNVDVSNLNSLCLSNRINVYYKFSDSSSTKYFLEMIDPVKGIGNNKINNDIDQYKRFVITFEEIRTENPKGIIVVDIPKDIYYLLLNNPVDEIIKNLSISDFKRQLYQLMECLLSVDCDILEEYSRAIEFAPNNDTREKLKSLAYDILMIQTEKYDDKEIDNVIKKLEYIYNLTK